ncbi:DUF6928 family protein [Kribbella sp. CA-293567]|uniref:DUF6928 family protein n=1 Tax=Kribbella sp. CA-293567 TaxID=3002436 RepID=UPI0022DE7E62|nr:hypothetical protein [Kribbella sp. CA-293567]WBQ06543.1 hypothetical protein OX958_07045 [Kribbella sp. CA-293567]
MGAKDWMLLYADGNVAEVLRAHPEPDRVATRALVERLHPGAQLTELADGDLSQNANPPDGLVYAAVFPGLTIVCTGEVALDRPSTLPAKYLAEAGGRTVYLHAMHSVVDWFAYAVWTPDGKLRRSLSLAPDGGVFENLGDPLPFEQTYWAGEHALEADDDDPYPLPFHPLELAEDALRTLFGFNYEGYLLDGDPDLESIVLAGYQLR